MSSASESEFQRGFEIVIAADRAAMDQYVIQNEHLSNAQMFVLLLHALEKGHGDFVEYVGEAYPRFSHITKDLM